MATSSKFNVDALKGKTEDELLAWSKAKREQWEKVKEAIGAGESDTLDDLSDVAPDDYEATIHDLTTSENLKPMEVAKLFKLVNAVRVSQGMEPVDFKPLSSKKAKLTPPTEATNGPGIADPLPDAPPSIPAGQSTQVAETLAPQTPTDLEGKTEEQEQQGGHSFGITPPMIAEQPPTGYVKPQLPAIRSNFSGKIKLNLHVDQAKDFEVPMLTSDEILVRRNRFLNINGANPAPPHQCTDEQLSALAFLVANQSPPYVDFGVWGPNNGRLQRRLKFTAQVPMADGSLKPYEMPGPDNLETWQSCWAVFRTACIMEDVAHPATLDFVFL